MHSRAWPAAVLLTAIAALSCEDAAKKSAEHAERHVVELVRRSAEDVKEVRDGLPAGARRLASLYEKDATPRDDLKKLHETLNVVRNRVQSLRVAKSNFFALADPSGVVLRNDQEQDRMAGQSLFAAYPALKQALSKYTETIGSMKEAAEVADTRKDAQWVAATPVRVAGETKAVYATGWSLSSYASRLEFSLRGKIRSELAESEKAQNEPLVYVFVVVGKDVYGAPVSPVVNMAAVARLDLAAKLQGDTVVSQVLEITGRDFGLAAQRAPSLGANVALAVLRSET